MIENQENSMKFDFGFPKSEYIIDDSNYQAGLAFDDGFQIYDIDKMECDNARIEKAVRKYIKFHSNPLYRLWTKVIHLIKK